MTPMFLPHTTLDTEGALGPAEAKGRMRLRALRDMALAKGAHVLLLVWPTLEWSMLAIETPPGVVINDTLQLIPSLLANPDALGQMQQSAREGEHLSWMQLLRPVAVH
jgi:hypothetical protein